MKIKPEDIVKASHFVSNTGGGGGIVPTGTKLITTTELVNVATFANAKVSDNDLVPENIKKDVNILGVVGEFEGSGTEPTGTKLITTTELVDVASFANAQVSDEDLVPENIKQGVNILGVSGSFVGGITVGSAKKTEIITIGANTADTPVSVLEYFGYVAPFPRLIIIALDAFTVNNQFAIFLSVTGGTSWARYRDGNIVFPNSFNTTWDARLLECSKYLLIEW